MKRRDDVLSPLLFFTTSRILKKKHVYLPRILGTKQYLMSTHDLRDSFAKREIRKILIAAVLMILVSAGYYLYLRAEIRSEAEYRANNVLKQTKQLIRSRMGRIETVVNDMGILAEHSLDNPDTMYSIARYMVESTPQITGADIAFIENYYPEKGKWFQPYVGYKNNSKELIRKQLGSESHNYLSQKWFQDGLSSAQGCWSDPYYDPDGGHASMITYAHAIHDTSGRRVGVISADITLDTLASIVGKIRIYPNSYCTLVSTSGEVIIGAPAHNKKRGRCRIYSEPIEGKNMVLTMTISNADMYKRLRKASLAFFFMALMIFISIFLIAYSSVQNLWRLGVERLKNQRIEDELAIAREIQMSLVPSKIEGKGPTSQLDIGGFLQPARFVGGDLYDYYVRDNKLFFCIGDISGKGVPAAMLMSISHSLFRTISNHVDDPSLIVKTLNNAISDNNPDCMFLTLFLGVLDLDTGVLCYCNAGHNPPVWIHDGQAKFVDSDQDMILGVEMEIAYTTHQLELIAGDTLFLYTDGLSEAENIRKELFGEQQILEIADGFGKISAEEQIEVMHQAVRRFVGTAEQSDDLTMLAIRFQGCGDTLVLDNDIQDLERLEPFLNDFFERKNLDRSHLSQMDLAMEEAIANVIMYAYPEGEKGTVEVFLEVEDNQIHACISDAGAPFNPLQQPDAELSSSIEERSIGGLGIHLIKEIMDKVEYQYKDGKNRLTMTMNI